MKMNAKINNNKSSDKKHSLNAFNMSLILKTVNNNNISRVLIYSTVQMKA